MTSSPACLPILCLKKRGNDGVLPLQTLSEGHIAVSHNSPEGRCENSSVGVAHIAEREDHGGEEDGVRQEEDAFNRGGWTLALSFLFLSCAKHSAAVLPRSAGGAFPLLPSLGWCAFLSRDAALLSRSKSRFVLAPLVVGFGVRVGHPPRFWGWVFLLVALTKC